ncbi:hypothetical protein [Ahrensia kielensis]|uniref:Uncharacterized protein n=1 Tax=Ahrensia kielensis TaxID=76980 RepID=A0ABU9T6J0_9HYPH|nr:hypothetical protein [Ahrensia kielensis]
MKIANSTTYIFAAVLIVTIAALCIVQTEFIGVFFKGSIPVLTILIGFLYLSCAAVICWFIYKTRSGFSGRPSIY